MKKRILGLGWLGLLLMAGLSCSRSDSQGDQDLERSMSPTPQPAGVPALAPSPAPPAADLPEPPAGAIVFNLKYRGLNVAEESLFSLFYYGNTPRDRTSPFIKAVKAVAKEPRIFENQDLKGREMFALEMGGGEPIAIYFDCNADGKFSTGEKLLPLRTSSGMYTRDTDFVSPDFWLTKAENENVLSRLWFQAKFNQNNKTAGGCDFSTGCILEGTAAINGKPVRLILRTDGLNGHFNRFGQSAYLLLEANQKPPARPIPGMNSGNVLPQALSRLVSYRGQFYRLSLQGRQENGHPLRAVLEKDTRPLSELHITLASESPIRASPGANRIVGDADAGIFLDNRWKTELPAGTYRVESGDFFYGLDHVGWHARFKDLKFNLEPNANLEMKLGNPVLKIKAIDEEKRFFNADGTGKSAFNRDAIIHLVPIIQGRHDEQWVSFLQQKTGAAAKTISPSLKILDATGKTILSQTIPAAGYLWDCSGVQPGPYTVIMSQDTGPWAGTIAGELPITIQN